MAKQTFTTGQVLTAAQMTSLQQTAMGGGSTTDKTTSYVLVAADAGTVVQMNAAGATTITVNTALFAAGDSVQIQNIGAGVCTITAGTATVSTAGSLALTQFEGGQLYFTAAGASVFFDYIQAGTTLPLTTKGDLFGFDTANARIPIGANNTVLTADSAQALGLKWAAPASAFVGCTATKLATQTIPDSTYTAINFEGTDITDTNNFHDPVTNNSRMTIPASLGGRYLILLSFSLSASTTSGSAQAAIYKNGAAIVVQENGFPGTAGGNVMERIMYVDTFVAGDYIQGYVWQSTGANKLIQSTTSGMTNQALFSIVYLGA